ncbi:hypothetical protein [Pusillimonas sp. ANT_WB101]|uniref:hypothetical protein n=1 Tax=Pusillimonas sp. ANT_WB101 TaxID=2597356 RepID=UPI0011EFB934|nr:hypothetical protein [Pusillimonas sp. ANT_WB101]KAA0889928.1 hypothetical protein FQ179_16355 [Pusillimonas sp. ANT_WB101]
MSQQYDLSNDPFFRLINDSEWNACIGPQGHEENYVDGYMEAAMYLSRAVLEQNLLASRDTLVLPILYNARHAIELSLKLVQKQLYSEGLLNDGPKSNHRIQVHFEKLESANLGDYEMRELIKRLSPFVESLAEIDDDGQQLRYAIDQEGNASLENRPLANLKVIHRSLLELSDILKHLNRRTHAFCEEHRTGTFTNRCSRSDLKAIAEVLVDFPGRRGTEYEQFRDDVKARYGLGNKTLLDAIKVIEANREMGALLGMEFSLKRLSDEKIRFAVACWTKLHPPRDPEIPRVCILKPSDVMWEMRDIPSSFTVSKELLARITTDELIDLDTIFHLSRERYFPESYDLLYERTQRGYAAETDHTGKASHLMSKTNFLKEVSRALTLLGRRNLSAEVWATRPDLL